MSALGRLVSGLSVIAVLAIVSQTDGAEFNQNAQSDGGQFVELDPLSAGVGFVDRDCWIIGETSSEELQHVDGGTLDEIPTATQTPCVELAEYEAFAVFDLANGEYPGIGEVASAASMGCQDRFQAFQGSSWIETSTGYVFVYPTRHAWEQKDDRQVTCAVTSAESLLTPNAEATQGLSSE